MRKLYCSNLSGNADYEDRGFLDGNQIDQGFVLACLTTVTASDLIIEIPNAHRFENDSCTEMEDETSCNQPEFLPSSWAYNGLTIRLDLIVSLPHLEDGLSDLDRLTNAIQEQVEKKEIIFPLTIVQNLADILRVDEGKATITLFIDKNSYHLIHITPTIQPTPEYGLAIDIGTTSIAVQLVSLPSAQVMATYSDYNDQIKCGQDVISRINYSNRPGGLSELRNRAVDTINRLIHELTAKHNVETQSIDNLAISANTTMVHLLLGVQPEYIRIEPYTPTLLEVPYFSAKDLGIDIIPKP